MKVTKLHIDSYKHLQNINFDFTYPDGHKNAGKPLKKICIIGQSATGKTSVLELIKNSIIKLDSLEVVGETYLSSKVDFDGELDLIFNDIKVLTNKNNINKNGIDFNYSSVGGSVTKFISDKIKLLYLSSELITAKLIDILDQNPTTILNPSGINKNQSTKEGFKESYNYQFGQEANAELWFFLLHKILDYRKRFTQMASELINKGAIGDPSKLSKEYNKWSENNENPLVSFANYFNPILKKLNLEVDLINTEYSIPIK
ncbi:MAG: hypothetical protein EOP43_06770, partial [Sphingobacteriaceae bacterium]